jgi:hypothetical protein
VWIDAIGYAGSVLELISFGLTTMVLLRLTAVLSSLAFLTYGLLTASLPLVFMEVVLIPLNAWRLWQMVALTRAAGQAAEGDLSLDCLKPHATPRRCAAGEILFRQGDAAEAMFLVESGRYRLPEIGVELGAGAVVGELGFLSPGNRRTQTLECIEAGTLRQVGYGKLRELYLQNPQFGLFFLRLVSARLFERIEAAERRAAPAAALRAG